MSGRKTAECLEALPDFPWGLLPAARSCALTKLRFLSLET